MADSGLSKTVLMKPHLSRDSVMSIHAKGPSPVIFLSWTQLVPSSSAYCDSVFIRALKALWVPCLGSSCREESFSGSRRASSVRHCAGDLFTTSNHYGQGETFLIFILAWKGACVEQAASSCCSEYFSSKQ